MHLGKPLQRRIIVPRTEKLTVPEADEHPPAPEAEAADAPVTDHPATAEARPTA